MFKDVIEFIQGVYKTVGVIPLHEPKFIGNEKKYLNKCIDIFCHNERLPSLY